MERRARTTASERARNQICSQYENDVYYAADNDVDCPVVG